MTGYYIELGYNSRFGGHGDEKANQLLLIAVAEICSKPESILAEVKRVEGVDLNPEYADYYRQPWKDGAIKVLKAPPDAAVHQITISQTASGGEPERSEKEAMRRAFCRLLIEAMHRQQIEVNLRVT